MSRAWPSRRFNSDYGRGHNSRIRLFTFAFVDPRESHLIIVYGLYPAIFMCLTAEAKREAGPSMVVLIVSLPGCSRSVYAYLRAGVTNKQTDAVGRMNIFWRRVPTGC